MRLSPDVVFKGYIAVLVDLFRSKVIIMKNSDG